MAAKSDWSGAITFAGFPIPVRVYNVLTSRKNASFKMLDPTHKQPVTQKWVDCKGVDVERAATLRGVQSSPDNYVTLDDNALEMIENVARSGALDIERFSPVSTVRVELSLSSYRVIPDEKVPGSDQPVQILWNGLRAANLAAVIADWCPRAGARPSTFVIRADDNGLVANLLPFDGELKDVPVFEPVVNEKAAAMFAAVIAQQYTTADFDLAAYTDGYAARRAAAVALALTGAPITVAKPADAPAAAVPDLMAMLEATLAAGPKPAIAPAPAAVEVAA